MKDTIRICTEISSDRIEEAKDYIAKMVTSLPKPWEGEALMVALVLWPRDAKVVLAEASNFGYGLAIVNGLYQWTIPSAHAVAKCLALHEHERLGGAIKMKIPERTTLPFRDEDGKESDVRFWKVNVPVGPAAKFVKGEENNE